MPSEIAVPFRVADGHIATVSDPDLQVRQHVRALVSTQPEERVMVPGYGLATNSELFSEADADELADQMVAKVSTAFTNWEPGVGVESVEAVDDDDGALVMLNVNYYRKDAADSGTAANANLAVIGANGVVREVVRG